jgi:hypothetical protein
VVPFQADDPPLHALLGSGRSLDHLVEVVEGGG